MEQTINLQAVAALQHGNINTLLQYISLLKADIYAEGVCNLFNTEYYAELEEDLDRISSQSMWVFRNVIYSENPPKKEDS